MKPYLTSLLFLAAILAMCCVSYLVGQGKGRKAGYADALASFKADTVVRVDTVVYDRPVEVARWRERTVYVSVTDTQIVHTTDSVYVALEREKKVYSGEEYQAVVSGIEPRLDEIRVFPKTVTITSTVVDKRRWAFGITAGPGVIWDRSFHGGIGVVVGVQYRF